MCNDCLNKDICKYMAYVEELPDVTKITVSSGDLSGVIDVPFEIVCKKKRKNEYKPQQFSLKEQSNPYIPTPNILDQIKRSDSA